MGWVYTQYKELIDPGAYPQGGCLFHVCDLESYIPFCSWGARTILFAATNCCLHWDSWLQRKVWLPFFRYPLYSTWIQGAFFRISTSGEVGKEEKNSVLRICRIKLPWEWPICNNNTRLFSSFKLIQRFCSAPLRLAQITHVFKAKAHYRSNVFIYYTAYKSVADLVL